MIEVTAAPFAWWEERRMRYNRGLIVAGTSAFLLYVAVCWILLPVTAGVEITLFTTVLQAIGYLVLIGNANIFYFLGPWSEQIIRPTDALRYRLTSYRLGFWISVILPFSIPVFIAVLAIFYPAYWSETY